ncbi:MAG: hypothetical protein KZQ94_09240 [Candidatus Thiodiazotropha sp. (ex Troendleina suluensis)]|nr:hypothetical protein [Candidatus Thiodiazotropha sp. (ex Troendleina suluensis)]
MELIEPTIRSVHLPRELTLAVVVSIGLHLLILWLLANHISFINHRFPDSALPQPLHITIAHPRNTQNSKAQQSPLKQNPALEIDPEKQQIHDRVMDHDASADTEIEPIPHPDPTSKQPITGAISGKLITTRQIMDTTATVIHDLPDDNSNDTENEVESVSAKLNQALNKNHKKPGVYSMADGTTRVVTEFDTTYCIKPVDDWRIIDPEDIMPVSMYCE